MKNLVFITLSILLLTGCDSWDHLYVEKTEIESVYYHELNTFSVAFLYESRLIMVNVPKATILLDADGKSWYECDYKRNSWNGNTIGGCTIHIKNIDELSTADWNHGKFGSGSTKRIH